MLAYYTTPYYNINAFDPFYSECTLMDNVVDRINRQLYYSRQQKIAERLSKPRVTQFASADNYNIQIFKELGDFYGYEVKVIRRLPGECYLKIKGNHDNFERVYEIDPTLVNVDDIDWKWFKEQNVLALKIPKRNLRSIDDGRRAKNVSRASKLSHKRRNKNKISKHKMDKLEAAIQQEQGHKRTGQIETHLPEKLNNTLHKEESQPEPFTQDAEEATCEHEENVSLSSEDSEAIESDMSSETESIHSRIPVKNSRLPSLEEVEDEEFVLLRKNML